MENLNDNKQEWLEIAVKEIRSKLHKLQVHDSYALINSVSGAIQQVSGGDVHKAEILYNYYGIFPDMGVGKGVSKGDQKVMKMLGGGRKAKPWSKEVAHQAHRFGDMVGKYYADHHIESIAKDLRKKIVFNF